MRTQSLSRLPVLASPLAALALAGCGDADLPGDLAAAAPPPGQQRLGSFVMHVAPKEGRVELRRIPKELEGTPRVGPENFNSLPIVSDDITGSGPANTVELSTTALYDTYNAAASPPCPANSYCGDVQLTHFYSGLNLSAVYVQVTAITTPSGQADTVHKVTNGVSSTPFGIDVSRGVWQYTALPGQLAAGAGATRTWAFANPDDADFYVYLDTLASYYPMIWFGASGGQPTITAPLVGGRPAAVHFEYARIPNCRGSSWSMQGYLKGNNIDIHTTSWAGTATSTFFDQLMPMPYGTGAALWFNNTDGTGCNVYDSNGGNNYNVGISSPQPAIHFAGPNANQNPYFTNAWSWGADAGVTGGASITVDYELDRIQCLNHDQYNRIAAGTDVRMGYNFDGGLYTEVSILGTAFGDPQGGQIFQPPTISIPSGSHQMKVYFYTTASSCAHPNEYDSNFGNNYAFNY